MAIDEADFARTIAMVFRKLILLQTTVHAMGRAMKDRDPEFEARYDAHRHETGARMAPLLAAIDQTEARADAAQLLEMLKGFNLPLQ